MFFELDESQRDFAASIDAALGAAVYLCRSGDLSAEPALRGAYLTYNRSLVYVDTVIGFATAYRDAVALPSPAAR